LTGVTDDKGATIEREFIEQMDAYYASPTTSFYDNRIEKRFLEQKIRHLAFKPYPKDGLVTFGASGTNMCDRQLVFKNDRATKPEKSEDLPHRGRQRRQGNSIVDFFQLDLAHMEKRLCDKALFTLAETEAGEYAMEDAAQLRQVFEVGGVSFAITAKPDGIFNYRGKKLLFEFKTKASGIKQYNSKLDYKGAQDDHLRQVTAESLIFGIREGIIVYESTQKPAWFSDEESKSVTKGQKTWKEGAPVPDLRTFYFNITDAMQEALLSDLARQAAIVYSGEIPKMHADMTGSCGFCAFTEHCKRALTDEEKTELREVEVKMAASSMSGKFQHRNLLNYLEGVE
jgi:hypothetical protein